MKKMLVILMMVLTMSLMGCSEANESKIDEDDLVGQWQEVEIWKTDDIFLFDNQGNIHEIRVDEYSDYPFVAQSDSAKEYKPMGYWKNESDSCIIEVYGKELTITEIEDERIVAITDIGSKAIFERVPAWEDVELDQVVWYGYGGGTGLDLTDYFN